MQTVAIPTSGGRRAVQSAGPASEGEAVGVVRRALTAQVVVHAPTLALARDLLCRSYRNNTAASCCLLPGACPAGAPEECTALCRLAVAATPAHCGGTDDGFEGWHRTLAELCAAHDICADGGADALGCGDTLSAGPLSN